MTDMILLTLASSAVLMLVTGVFTRLAQEDEEAVQIHVEDEVGL